MVAISVIIPTYNRAGLLRKSLGALSRQTQPTTDFEVIVVIDGSTDETAAMLAGLATPYALRVLTQPHGGQHTARNTGIAVANGQYCLFLDDDVVAEPDLVAEHFRAQRHHGNVVALGRLDLALPPGAPGFVRAYAEGWRNHYDGLESSSRSPGWADCYGGNLSVPRRTLLEMGGFAPDLPRCHDVELGYRLEQAKLPFIYLPRAAGRQIEEKDTRALARVFERSGATWFTLYERHPAMLPELLGGFNAVRRREVILRRLLLALDLPVGPLALLGGLIPGRRRTKWHCFLHRYCYWRGVRRSIPNRDTWRRLTHGTTILMYHAFAEAGEQAGRYVVLPRRFAAQLRWLKWLRYRPLTLDQYLECRREHRLPPTRAVVITIDDGYADARTVASPILSRYGFPATVFVVTQAVGLTNGWSTHAELGGRRLLSWPDIRALRDANVQFGAHSRTHPLLPSVPVARAHEEIAGSRGDLEREIGSPVTTFAYPYGAYDSTVEAVVQQAGLQAACGADLGFNHAGTSLYRLRRTAVDGTDSLLRFAVKVSLGVAGGADRQRRTHVVGHAERASW